MSGHNQGSAPTCQNSVSKVYDSVVDDVISGVREAFLDEGVDEQVLQELKMIWLSKIRASNAVAVQADAPQKVSQQQQQQQVAAVQQYMQRIVNNSNPAGSGKQYAQNQPAAVIQTAPPRQQQQLTLPTVIRGPSNSNAQMVQQFQQQYAILPGSAASLDAQQRHLIRIAQGVGVPTIVQNTALSQASLTFEQVRAGYGLIKPETRRNLPQLDGSVALPEEDDALPQHSSAKPGSALVPKKCSLSRTDKKPKCTVVLQVDGANASDDDSDDFEDDDEPDAVEADAADDQEEDDLVDDKDQQDLAEEGEPLGPDDDISDEEDPEEMFDAENVVVCQYEKINRTKNKWKLVLKDGIMNLNGKDYVFQKATGEAEW